MDDDIRIRRLADDDWEGVAALEAGAYSASGLSEGRAALESRGRSSPTTCFAVERRGRLGGYLLSLPYPLFHCPDLAREERAGFRSSNLHVHDVVIAEELRGRGLAPRLLNHLARTARAQGYERLSMVAVGGTEVLWSPLGYSAHPEVAFPESYGAHAVYMSMALGAAPAEPSKHTSDPLYGSPPKDEVG
ncbi:GNAT family N-acetyltransferase [Kitasatospora sp. NPDC092286]|uniref:GNAT family N-acetyltransferase n=1 Tax=Kitasatospora sp. NPDC092286 TaxID=3364087 RepID=UPI00381ECBC9